MVYIASCIIFIHVNYSRLRRSEAQEVDYAISDGAKLQNPNLPRPVDNREDRWSFIVSIVHFQGELHASQSAL